MKILALLLTGFAISTAMAQSEKDGVYQLDKEYKVKSTGTIRLNASDAKVKVVGSARTTAHIKIDRQVITKGFTFGEQEFRIDVNEQDGNLSIREDKRGSVSGVVGYHSEKYTINLQVPEGMSVVIDGDDGDYLIQSVHGSIELDVDDADVELTSCNGNFFSVKLDDGDLRMDIGKGELQIDADDADIEIKNAAFEKISAEMDDGDFVVETTLVENGNYFVSAQDGLVAMKVLSGGGKFEIRHDDASINAAEGFEITEQSETRTRITTASGNARVEIRADDARVRLTR
jgi:Putative adhesin